MVRTLLLASSSTSSSSDNSTTTASRDSTGSSASNESNSSFNSDLVLLAESCDSSRPSSVTDQDEEFKRLTATTAGSHGCGINNFLHNAVHINKKSSSNRLSGSSSSSVKRMSSSAKEVIRKYMKKVKPLYEKLSQKQGVAAAEENNEPYQPRQQKLGRVMTAPAIKTTSFSTSKYPRRKSCISSCPSSIRSSPSHSGVLCRPGFAGTGGARGGSGYNNGDMNMNTSTSSSMEELQSAIQGAIAHCKNSLLIQNKTMAVSSNEI
uniref:Membrane-associated kinase regulator 1 n=1 Tax=Cannabis sativa TaxID=3483 RepID=A0A803Q2A8_CANSA